MKKRTENLYQNGICFYDVEISQIFESQLAMLKYSNLNIYADAKLFIDSDCYW